MISNRVLLGTAAVMLSSLSACSALPPEMQESLNDIRGSMPGPLRGDAQALKDAPTASVAGAWSDRNTPELAVSGSQSGTTFTLMREGVVNERTVRQRIEGTVEGRALTAKRTMYDANELRPTYDECAGAVSADNQRIRLTCGKTSMNFDR